MKQTAVEFKHTKVVSPSGNELFFDEQGKFIKEEPKQQTAVEWFAEKMENLYFVNFKKFFSLEIEQAKELEKEQQGYSEEEVLELLQDFANDLSDNVINIKFWFNKFKKK